MNRGMLTKSINYIRNVDKTIGEKPIDNVFKGYSNAVREMLELYGSDKYEGSKIVVESQVIDGEEFSDVFLEDGTDKWALDFVDWNDIIDLPVEDRVSVEVSEMLAHVVYDITWWGFTRESINQQARELENIDKDNIIEVDWDEFSEDVDNS